MPHTIFRSAFTEDFVALNYPEEMESFRWIFLPGMLFQDQATWWKEGRRARCHEGVDFCRFYAGRKGLARQVGADRVPALFDGEVVRVENDFLAQTVWMRHEAIRNGNMMLYSALAHVEPSERTAEGRCFDRGEIAATIGRRKDFSPMAMHLHISVFWAPHFLKASRLDWHQLPGLREISMIDPLRLIGHGP